MIDARTEANERFFAAESSRIAELSRLVAERFLAGGRLLAVGATAPDRSDAHHVAVEFVHPVIVGKRALPALALDRLDLLVIENVGNLVCPAEFRVGEHHRVMVSAVTEGEDKPLKYPLMFRACELVLVNKVDLLPHLEIGRAHV